jgi:glycogen operon protein
VPDEPQFYMDYTGTGNSLNVRHPQVLKMIMDSLRYWRTEMHVDGFRFDLAATLARELHEVSKLSSFFDTIHQDPTLADVKLIAEPWDVGDGGYQVGNFPVRWAEWNGKYRDTVRRFWKGDAGMLSDFAYRLTGSSDLYQSDGRRPYASINFVTAHDGFTLNDLVSYNEKHNQANSEGNRDGSENNDSWNMGEEGPTENTAVNEMRERQMRNFLATLMVSQGVPMLTGGDEFSRTQMGNNNAYCQDTDLTWFNWKRTPTQQRLLNFTRRIIQLRMAHPNLRRRKFFQDRVIRTPMNGRAVKVVKDIAWYSPDGKEVTDEAWSAEWIRSIALLLNGQTLQITGENGGWVIDHSFLLIVNASHEGVEFILPPSPSGNPWIHVVDTENMDDPFAQVVTDEKVIVGGRSLKLVNDALPA